MDIKKLSDLRKIMSLCRTKGIESFKISDNSVEFKLSATAPARKRSSKNEPDLDMPAEQFTPEQILLWSSQGIPDAFEGN